MCRFLWGSIFLAMCAFASAEGIDGVWRTEDNDDGAHLEVTFGPCDSDATKVCGLITAAITREGLSVAYENVGKLMIRDMVSDDGRSFSGGTLWDPEKDKIVKSKLVVNGDDLRVIGCVAFICLGQTWVRLD